MKNGTLTYIAVLLTIFVGMTVYDRIDLIVTAQQVERAAQAAKEREFWIEAYYNDCMERKERAYGIHVDIDWSNACRKEAIGEMQ